MCEMVRPWGCVCVCDGHISNALSLLAHSTIQYIHAPSVFVFCCPSLSCQYLSLPWPRPAVIAVHTMHRFRGADPLFSVWLYSAEGVGRTVEKYMYLLHVSLFMVSFRVIEHEPCRCTVPSTDRGAAKKKNNV